MANNIRIVGSILNTTNISRYLEEDVKLMASKQIQENFGGTGDYIEFFVQDAGENLLNTNYNYLSYKLPTNIGLTPGVSTTPNTTGEIQTTNVGIDSTLATPTSSLYPIIEIDPVKDLQDLGYSSGEFKTRYNFFQTKISDFINQDLFIKEISQDRTEVRLASTTLTNEQIESGSLELINEINAADYYVDYLLNFGDNEQYVAVNVALNKAPEGYEILFKLYQPLPLSVQEKMTLWVVEEKVIPYVFDINLDKLIIPPPPPTLRGPNFDIEIPNQGTVSTGYNTYSNLVGSLQSLQNSSYQQILNLLATQSVDINIDYSNFDNFVFFGSAYQRVNNFYNKVKQIEDYSNLISTYTPLTSSKPSLITEINQYSSSITSIISQFDGFEYYLYFESGSTLTSSLDYNITPYPKSGSLKPFTLLSTGSVSASVWFNWATGSALDYDNNNYDNLEFAIPNFVKDDHTNQPFFLFLNMVGHYFDNIWIYLNSITDINLANNNLEVGISKDLVYERLKSLGLRLYNSQAGEDVSQYLIGANTGSSMWDNNTTVTGSYLNNIPRKDLVSELYKRIYHNLPLLVKTKGTVAGLDHLMTVFGIPNQTYYTIGSQSFYTPTGSAATASILNVKEFGGGLKSSLINGYNNDKVRIVPNSIVSNTIYSGSVLSPFLSLQTFPTASSQFRENDSHYIDISFSPETQIDTYISGAIASNNPTWSLDDYIGDPRQQYLNSYPDLDAQRKLYFETGVSGFAPFTASLLDYNGFIRLIQYFDNALFKMLNDFVPERTSLSTGVTINSPVLERNKAAYNIPYVNTQSVYEADYDLIDIQPQYGQLYNILQGDKKPFYTGEISGSVVDVNQYFEDDFNPYDGDWNVWNAQNPINKNINLNTFLHSDWNVLLNNVSKSVVSNVRKHIEYVWGTTGSITSSAELQDSYLTLRSYNTSRYEGSKTISLLYNTYTSASYTGSNGFTIQNGDKSFGKTAAIDRQSYKIGWVKNIPSQSLNFPDKTLIALKYLVDKDSNLLELSYANLNLPEVQNTFKSGTPVVVSLSDVRKPSYQVPLDGTKSIFKGGIWYDPILFREGNETLNFTFEIPITSSISNPTIKAYSNNQQYWYYNYRRPGLPSSTPNSETYVWEINGVRQTAPMAIARYFTNQWKYSSSLDQRLNYTYPATFAASVGNAQSQVFEFDLIKYSNVYTNTEPVPNAFTSDNNSYIYKVPRSSTYNIKASTPFYIEGNDDGPNGSIFKVFCLVESCDNESLLENPTAWNFVAVTNPTVIRFVQDRNWVNVDSNYNTVWVDGYYSLTMNLDLNVNVSLNQGHFIRYRLYIVDLNNIFTRPTIGDYSSLNFSINLSPGSPITSQASIFITDTTTQIQNFVTTTQYTNYLFTTGSTPNSIKFDSGINNLIISSSIFTPKDPSAQYYTPVIDNFSIRQYDLFRFGSFTSPNITYYEVASVTSSFLPPFTLSGRFYSLNPTTVPSWPTQVDYFIASASSLNDAISIASKANINDQVIISNTTNNNITASITNIVPYIFNFPFIPTKYYVYFYFNKTVVNEPANISTNMNNVIFTPITPSTIVNFYENINTGSIFNSQNFAILRPKPNETSVIINYKKQPGEVSQTVLIPYDANDEIKNSVGNIYKTINPDIS